MNREPEDLSAHLQLSLFSTVRYRLLAAKLPLCLLVAFSSLFGFTLSASRLGWQGCGVFISVLMLACGGATLNSYQEHRRDRLMKRTRDRPVASGVLLPERARRQGQVLAGTGLFLLYLTTWSAAAVIAGASALVLYNTVYTPLKHRTIWAIVPGALCGAMPPYIGWLAAGGALISPVILAVAAAMVLWQVPHFWLVLLNYRSQYRCSMQPNLARMMAEPVLKYLSVVWVAALLVVLQTMVAMMAGMPAGLRIMISATGFGLLLVFGFLMVVRREPNYRFLFMLLNVFMLYIMAMFTVGSLVV